MSASNRRLILILLFELGFILKFNFIGSISLSEIFLVLSCPIYLARINWRQRDMFIVLVLYLGLFCSQVLSEIIVGSSVVNALKGLAVTVVSFLHFSFLYRVLGKELRLIPVLVLSLSLSILLAGPQEALMKVGYTLQDVLLGEGAPLLKMYIAPVVIYLILFLGTVLKWSYFPLVFSVIGVTFVILGARSWGAIMILAGVLAFLLVRKPRLFSRSNILAVSLITVAVSYLLYALYVGIALSGEITSGNTAQLLKCDNPYNPFELLARGRAETWVGLQAFFDRFLFGHGSWATDNSGYYHRLLMELHSFSASGYSDMDYLIPSHSVLVGYAMSNGILALIIVSVLVFFFLKKGLVILTKVDNRFKLVLLFFVVNLVWTSLFSPISHFRQDIPLFCAVIMVLFNSVKEQYEE